MTDQELKMIEFFENNRVPWKLLTDEEKAFAGPILRKWWSCFDDNLRASMGLENDLPDGDIATHHVDCRIYRLKPEYRKELEKPKAEWVEYEVYRSKFYDFTFADGLKYRSDAANGLSGFGGIQYKQACGCDLPSFKFQMTPPEPCEKHGPHEPVKVRFWRVKHD